MVSLLDTNKLNIILPQIELLQRQDGEKALDMNEEIILYSYEHVKNISCISSAV